MRLGRRFRWAVAASVGGHALIVFVCAVITRRTPEPHSPASTRIETRVTFVAECVPEPQSPAAILTTPDPTPVASVDPTPRDSEPPPSPEVALPPLAQIVRIPAVLPSEVISRLRSFAPSPGHPDVEIQHAAGVEAAPVRHPSRPAHGALAAGQRVVYLLDASGSMGEWGKFDAARAAIAATLAVQPPTVVVTVVTYSTSADVVASAALASRAPAGRGDHVAGLRLALEQSPDFVVWFTDTDDVPMALVRTQLLRAGKPVTLVVARVSAAGVAAPVELR